MKTKFILHILLLIAACLPSQAQETIFRNFTPTTYRGGTQNWDIIQLPDGQMAIANNLGLLIYNGNNWSIYPIRNYSTVRALYFDRTTGRLYASGSEEFGYYQVDPLTYQFTYHSLSDRLPAHQRNFGEVWRIVPWGDKLVFQSKTHLFILNKQGKFSCFHPSYRIETIAEVKGHLILGTRRGLEEWRGNKSTLLPGATFKTQVIVRSILSYGGQLLIATQENGIMTYDGKQLHEDATDLAPLLKKNQIFCAELSQDRLAIGTVKAGLIVKDLRNGGHPLYLNNSKGLLNNTILSTTFDAEGNIWLGLDNGLSCALTNVPFQNVISEQANIGMGYTSMVYANKLYLGTNQGLYMQEMPLMQQLTYRSPVPVNGISGQIWNLSIVGNTLLCCADRGLYRIVGTEAKRIEGVDGVWGICSLTHHPGYLLATDYLGVVLLHQEGDGYKMVHRLNTDVEGIGNLLEDTDGTLWSSHWQKGIYHLCLSPDMKTLKRMETFDGKHGLVIDQNNLLCKIRDRIYVSCVDGIYHYDRRTRKLVYDKAMSKVFDTYGTSLKITETPQHDLWAQKADFLAIAHPKGKGYTVDSTSYRGIAGTQQIGLGNLYALDMGYTLINGNSGFYLARNHGRMNKHNYPLYISKITSTNKQDSIVYRRTYNTTGEQRLTLPHSLNSIVIEFVEPEYIVEDAITYSYYLEHYDKQWSQSGTNTKEYTHLSKGKYTFHVRAFNRISGKTQETRMEIVILPAWYETIWAYIVYMLLGGYVFYLLLKYLKFRADREVMIERTKRKAEVTEMENEKLQTELKHKSSELASSTMSSIHQNDILQKLDEEMALLSESVRREDKKAVVTSKINDIRGNLQSYLNNDEGWEKFEENFNVVYDDFMKKLTEKYTTLKVSDRKLCAYLRMGLSSKEMASLLNMSVRSIETARYRLRKKLNLESGENLTDFIQNFK